MERVKIAGSVSPRPGAGEEVAAVVAVALIAPDTWGIRADFDDGDVTTGMVAAGRWRRCLTGSSRAAIAGCDGRRRRNRPRDAAAPGCEEVASCGVVAALVAIPTGHASIRRARRGSHGRATLRVTCTHCKRTVVIVSRVTGAELDRLQAHLLACCQAKSSARTLALRPRCATSASRQRTPTSRRRPREGRMLADSDQSCETRRAARDPHNRVRARSGARAPRLRQADRPMQDFIAERSSTTPSPATRQGLTPWKGQLARGGFQGYPNA